MDLIANFNLKKLLCLLYILLDVPAEFRKGKGIRYQTTDIPWIIEKATEFQKKNQWKNIGFSDSILWKNINEIFGQHNT